MNRIAYLVAALAITPQLRAQATVPPRKKPDTVSVQVRGTDWAAVPAQPTRPIPKESILRVDTLRAATRSPGGICNYDQKAARALTPTPGSGTRLLPIYFDPVACRIIVVTVDSAKFIEATKQAKPDTLVKPAVIYSYPGRFTKDSVPAHIPDSVVRWMKDTVRVRLGDRRKDMVIGEPRVKGDTAWVPATRTQNTGGDRFYEFAIEHRFERRGGVWALTNQFTVMHGHGGRTPDSPAKRDSLDVKSRP